MSEDELWERNPGAAMGMEADVDIDGLPPDQDINVCPLVAERTPPPEVSTLGECFLCEEPIWRSRQAPKNLTDICIRCCETRAPAVAAAARRAWRLP